MYWRVACYPRHLYVLHRPLGGRRWGLAKEPCMTETSRVLVVDDEPQINRVLRTVLTSQGYQVHAAADGASALATFSEWLPHLVLTDLCMPHMDGVELCRRIRAVSDVPIIVLSVKGAEQAKVE